MGERRVGKHDGQRGEPTGSARLHGEKRKEEKENKGCEVASDDESSVLARQWGRGRRTRKATRAVWAEASKQPTTHSPGPDLPQHIVMSALGPRSPSSSAVSLALCYSFLPKNSFLPPSSISLHRNKREISLSISQGLQRVLQRALRQSPKIHIRLQHVNLFPTAVPFIISLH